MVAETQRQRWPGESRSGLRQRGFTLIELAIATVVFLVGVVAVMQLVPASLQSNLNNRVDTSSVVLAQRELDQMTDQPLSSASFTDADGNVCNLGNSATPDVVVGSPVIQVGNSVRIDFNAATVAGYNFKYTNPQDPTDGAYDVRWAVISNNNAGGTVASKRFIVGVWRRAGGQMLAPVTLDAWQQLVR